MRAAQQAHNAAVAGGRAAIALQLNDFSNINGGYFPPHGSHRQGQNIDAVIRTYVAFDRQSAVDMAAVATEIRAAALARGWQLRTILVHPPDGANGVFFQELARLTVGGLPASQFIRWIRDQSHENHFHVELFR